MSSQGRHPGRRRHYMDTIDFVARGMDYLCGRTTELSLTPSVSPAPVHSGNLGQVRCTTRIAEGNNVPTPRPQPVRSTKEVVQPALTAFWRTFNPDEPDLEEVPDVPLDDLWDAIRLNTAPWGTDDREPPTPPDSIQDDEDSGCSQPSSVFTTSAPEDDHGFSGAPLRVRLGPVS